MMLFGSTWDAMKKGAVSQHQLWIVLISLIQNNATRWTSFWWRWQLLDTLFAGFTIQTRFKECHTRYFFYDNSLKVLAPVEYIAFSQFASQSACGCWIVKPLFVILLRPFKATDPTTQTWFHFQHLYSFISIIRFFYPSDGCLVSYSHSHSQTQFDVGIRFVFHF